MIPPNFVWYRDLSALEFTHDQTFTHLDHYLSSLESLTKLVDIQLADLNHITHPNREDRLSYHLNLSVPAGVRMEDRLRMYNYLLMLRLVNAGREGLAIAPGRTHFDPEITAHGLVRWKPAAGISRFWFEVRRHVLDPRAEVEELVRWFSDSSADGAQRALAEMAQEARGYLNEANLERMKSREFEFAHLEQMREAITAALPRGQNAGAEGLAAWCLRRLGWL